MRHLISALTLCAGAVVGGLATAQQAPAEFDPSDFGKIIIQPRQSAGGGGLVFEQAFGDYQNEPIIKYGKDSPIIKLGRPIGRLDMLFTNGKTAFCTAFIVDDQHVLTNHHCIPGMDGDPTGRDSGVQAAQFVAGFIEPGSSVGVDRYTVSPQIIETNRELDYTVLRVFGNPSTKYGKLELAEADPEDSEFLWIIGHPQGQAMHISREGCAAANPAVSAEGKLMHTCDTLGGNSGSPVIRLSDKRVIGLHHAGDSVSGFNMAIPMTRILPQSRVLKASVGPTPSPTPTPRPTPAPKPVVNACSAMWAEAKILGCAGYEAYADECGDHTFASMAKRIIERECTVAVKPTPKPNPTIDRPKEVDGPVLTVRPTGGDYSEIADAVAAANPGTTIQVYPGTYTRGIDVAKRLEIVGVGNKRDIILKVAEDNTVRWTAESGRIANMTIMQDGGKFFNFHIAAGSVILEDSDLTSQGLAVLAIRDNSGATIRRNTIRDGAQGGIFMFESGQAVIEDNTFFGNRLAAIEVKDGSDPVVKGNTMRDGGGSGIFINENGKGRYEGNTIFNNGLSGIEIKAADNPLVSGNTVRDGQQGGIMTSDAATSRITKNEIYGNAYASIEIKTGANPQVYENILRDGQQSGIYIHDGGNGVIENNEIIRNGFYGISVKGDSNPIVRGNTIASNVYEAIRIREGAGGTYERNDMSGNTAGTFRIEPDAGNVIRVGNIEGPGTAAPKPDVSVNVLSVKALGGGDYREIADAVAAADPDTRIEVYPGTYTKGLDVAKPLEIVGVGPVQDIVLKVADDNAIRWTADSGRIARMTIMQDGGKYFNVHVAAGSVIIEDSDLTSQGLAVLAIRDNDGATIRRNTIRDSAQGGIFMFEGGLATIEDNEFYGNRLAALELKEGADPFVKDNIMRDGGGSGIFINEGGKGHFEGNTIFNNGLSGIEVKAADNPLITGNVIRDGQQGGIMTSDDAVSRITKNEIYGNAYASIEIKTGANPQVSENILRDGQQSAIYIHEGGRGVIENNEIFRNGFYGISVKGTSNPIVRGNTISKNVYEAIRVREGAGGTYENNDLTGNTAGAFRIEADAGSVIRRGNSE